MAALREWLVRAAEDNFAWERRADFDSTQDDAVATVGFTQAPAPSGGTAVLGTAISTQESAEVPVTSSAPRIAAHDPATTPWTTAAPTQDGAPGYRGGVPCKVLPRMSMTSMCDPAAWIHQMARHRASADGRMLTFLKSIPRITLPTYHGSPEEWPPWIGLFNPRMCGGSMRNPP